jgi:glycosyltransferase involved in cell wall biosynthesis
MRIVHVLPHLRNVGDGIVNATVDLACEQSRLGCEVFVASEGGDFEALLAEYGVELLRQPVTRKPHRVPGVLRSFRQLLERRSPEIVHAHTLTTLAVARISRISSRSKARIVTTAHTEFYKSTPALRIADRVIAPSKAIAAALRRRAVPPGRIRVVMNGTLGGPRAKSRSVVGPGEVDHPAVVSVAGMYERKGIADLIDAFSIAGARLPAAHLYLVGDGPDRERFEQRARDSGFSSRIHFLGYQKNPLPYLLGADVFVLASHRDPCPLVVIEARDAGCPILASNVDGIPELLEDGRAGRLFTAGDSRELASEIERFLTDDAYRDTWKQASRQNIEWLGTDRVARDTIAVYEELLRR